MFLGDWVRLKGKSFETFISPCRPFSLLASALGSHFAAVFSDLWGIITLCFLTGFLGEEELIDKMEDYFDIYECVYIYYVNIYECSTYTFMNLFQYACIYIYFVRKHRRQLINNLHILVSRKKRKIPTQNNKGLSV